MSTTAVAGTERALAREMGRTWWLFLVSAAAWLIFAFVVLSFDFTTVWAVAVFAGASFIGAGVLQFAVATQVDGSGRWAHVLLGALSVGAGIVAFAWPGATFVVLAGILAWFLLFRGTFDIVASLVNRDVDFWWVGLLVGIAQVLVGFWALSYTGRSLALLAVWVGAAALARGFIDIMLAFRLRELGKSTTL